MEFEHVHVTASEEAQGWQIYQRHSCHGALRIRFQGFYIRRQVNLLGPSEVLSRAATSKDLVHSDQHKETVLSQSCDQNDLLFQ